MATNPSEGNIHPLIMDLIGRMSRLEARAVFLEGNGPNWTGAIDNLEKKLMISIEKISSDMKKMAEDAVYQKYETDAIAIEKEEQWKREKEELMAEISRLRRETEGRSKEVSDKQQGVSDAITALQEGIAEISHKIGRMEGKQSEDHLTIQARPVPLEEKRQLIPGQVDKGTILVLGGGKNGRGTDEMVILKQDKWIKLPLELPKQLYEGGAVYLDGEIYVFGGSMAKKLYKLDNKTLKWIRLADMNEGRWGISNSSVEWNGSIWVFGGEVWNGSSYLKSVERYDPKENKWFEMPDMKYWRDGAAAAVHNGKFIVCGGSNILKSVECFDPESGVWTELNDMPTPLSHHSLVSYGNNLILMGGDDGNTAVNTVLELSNLEGKGTWKELPPMEQPRFDFSAAVLDNEIFVIGGYNVLEDNDTDEDNDIDEDNDTDEDNDIDEDKDTDEDNDTNEDKDTDEDLDKTEVFNGKSWREGPFLPNECCYMSSIVIPRHLADILSNSTE